MVHYNTMIYLSRIKSRLGANQLTPDEVDDGLACCAINSMSDAGQELKH